MLEGLITKMRIISGKARGTKLYTLEGTETRPTLDRVKESLFNIIQKDIEDSVVLDLFAGSGAIAIEFLSRGASQAYVCDNNPKAVEMIKKNLQKTHLEQKAKVYSKDYKECLKDIQKIQFDIIFLDPPYKADCAIEAMKCIKNAQMLKDCGKLIIETDEPDKYLQEIENKNINFEIYDLRKYGRASLIFLK